MESFFWITATVIIWVYLGYPVFLYVLSRAVKRKPTPIAGENLPSVTVLVAAYNEEEDIADRVRNLLAQDYPEALLQIIVASDGSSDQTCQAARAAGGSRVLALDFHQRRGKAGTQNEAIKHATGEILVFTDADTEFEPDFLRRVASYFADPKVGCVTGRLTYVTSKATMSRSEGLYWKYELLVRKLSSRMGILATGTGACLALRRSLYRPQNADDGEDCVCPLDAVIQGRRVVHAEDAVAYDYPAGSVRSEIRARIRMTSKNLRGTLRRWGFSNWLKHPAASFGLVSHRLLRWLSPYCFILLFISNIFLLGRSPIYIAAFAAQALFYAGALAGWWLESKNRHAPVVSSLFAFCVANYGMLVGVIKGARNQAPRVYEMPNELA